LQALRGELKPPTEVGKFRCIHDAWVAASTLLLAPARHSGSSTGLEQGVLSSMAEGWKDLPVVRWLILPSLAAAVGLACSRFLLFTALPEGVRDILVAPVVEVIVGVSIFAGSNLITLSIETRCFRMCLITFFITSIPIGIILMYLDSGEVQAFVSAFVGGILSGYYFMFLVWWRCAFPSGNNELDEPPPWYFPVSGKVGLIIRFMFGIGGVFVTIVLLGVYGAIVAKAVLGTSWIVSLECAVLVCFSAALLSILILFILFMFTSEEDFFSDGT
jgi:hypothetical protein